MARFHALPVILFGALLGAVLAVLLQPDLVAAYGGAGETGRGLAMLEGRLDEPVRRLRGRYGQRGSR
jgi:Na+:H+ antiporter, NhaC family